MKTKMNLQWRWLLGLSLMLCWLGGAGPNAVAQGLNHAAEKMMRSEPAQVQQPTVATAPGKVVASVPMADLPTEKVARYRRGRKAALRDTVRFTVVWPGGLDFGYAFNMMLAGEGEGIIDWGDGTQSACSAAKNEAGDDYVFGTYDHPYEGGDDYEVTVYTTSPDLQIMGLSLYYWTDYDSYTMHSGVDVRACPSLKYLYCSCSWLGTLDVTQNAALEELGATRCRLTSLSLPQASALKELGCGGNRLTSLDVSGCPALRQLYCWDNQLTSLDVSACPALDSMQCSGNQFGWATLDALSKLNCSFLSISPQKLSFEVGLNEAVDLSGYMTYKSQQTVCDFSAMPSSAYTFTNGILKIKRAGSFTVSMSNPAVKRNGESQLINCNVSVGSGVSDTVRWVWQQNGGIDYVNLTIAGNATSIVMDWGDGTIETEDVNANGFRQIRHIYATAGEYTVKIWGNNQWVLSGLELFGHSHVQSLDLSDCPYLESLVCSGNDLTALDLSACLSLRLLNCAENKLTSLDLSNNLNLQQLNCAENQLPSLDVSANGKLQQLYCNGNQLPSLNVAQNTNLTHLYCWNNQLTSLNVRALTKLQYLSCSFNQLTSLDLSQNTVLELLYGGYNALTSLDATHNPLLATLECHHNQLISLSVNTNTRFKVLDCGYNRFGWATLDALSALEGEKIVLSPQVLPSLDVNLNEAVDFSAYATYNGRSTVFSLGNNTPASAYTLENGILKLKSPGVYTVNMSNPGVTFKGNPVIISRELIAWPGASDTLRWVVMDSANQLHLNAVCDASFVVDWGDGKKETVSVSGQSYNDDIKHSYAAIGEYAVTVYGLKHFMLLHLSLRSNVQSLDVRACPFLEFLECESHQLSSLDVSKNTALTTMYFRGKRLSSLDVSKNTDLP
ncbi:MAG: leucine-rich repeat domain-containing protein, partial [Bacteroidales bacterium]|nr:leucine-rich repeat domain-containing protein [Bacteroidales bacterium]